jgi:hypothetical protein
MSTEIVRRFNVKLFLNCVSALILTIGIVTTISCFIIFYLMHSEKRYIIHGVRQLPTLSLTGSYFPANIIFTYGLHSMSFLFFGFFGAVFLVYEEKIAKMRMPKDDNARLCFRNKLLFYLSVMFSILMSLVGSISLEINSFIHGTVAFLMFVTICVHMLVFYIGVTRHVRISDIKIRLIRFALFLYIPFNIGVVLLLGLILLLCDSDSCWSFVVNMQPCLEFSTIAAIMIYMLSFSQDNSGGPKSLLNSIDSDSSDGNSSNTFFENYDSLLYGKQDMWLVFEKLPSS